MRGKMLAGGARSRSKENCGSTTTTGRNEEDSYGMVEPRRRSMVIIAGAAIAWAAGDR